MTINQTCVVMAAFELNPNTPPSTNRSCWRSVRELRYRLLTSENVRWSHIINSLPVFNPNPALKQSTPLTMTSHVFGTIPSWTIAGLEDSIFWSDQSWLWEIHRTMPAIDWTQSRMLCLEPIRRTLGILDDKQFMYCTVVEDCLWWAFEAKRWRRHIFLIPRPCFLSNNG